MTEKVSVGSMCLLHRKSEGILHSRLNMRLSEQSDGKVQLVLQQTANGLKVSEEFWSEELKGMPVAHQLIKTNDNNILMY